MAVVPKTAPLPAPPSTSTLRSSPRVGPSTRVASVDAGVDETQGSLGVSFDSSMFGFQEEGRPSFDRGSDHRPQPFHGGLVNAPTDIFAAMIESGDPVSSGGNAATDVKERQFGVLVSKAIAVYENTARVISGDNLVLGTSFSIEL